MAFSGRLAGDLSALGLDRWPAALGPLVEERLANGAHGDMPRWRRALEALPPVSAPAAELDSPTVTLAPGALPAEALPGLRRQLLELSPWRKGPFDVAGVSIDSEWRSDLKWQRVQRAASPLAGRRVLDVGCGNGYYALRMLGAGAACVIGVDPTLLYVMQFRALAHFLGPRPVHVLPLRSEELPPGSAAFDTVLSMGVLYHQRAPLVHLRELRSHLRGGGELVLETLVLPGEEPYARTPPGRYARMRNVWHLPTVPELCVWLARCGFRDIAAADVTLTSVAEQRSTEWMTFESLGEALDPDDPSQTVEGWPAPRRAVVIARRP